MLVLQNIEQIPFPDFESFIVEEEEGSGIMMWTIGDPYILRKLFFICYRSKFCSYQLLQVVMVQFTGQDEKLMV